MTSFYCSSGWTPRTDVQESESGYQLQLDLPGVKAEDLAIQVEDSTLTVRAQRKFNGKREEYHRVERPYGEFARSFTLPEAINASGIEAKLTDGVLNLTLPRREEAKPRQITVSVQ